MSHRLSCHVSSAKAMHWNCSEYRIPELFDFRHIILVKDASWLAVAEYQTKSPLPPG